jgi:copper(I)-binding protein
MKSVVFAFVLILDFVGCSAADEFRGGDIVIDAPWARASAGRVATGVVYARLTNRGAKSDKLIAVAAHIAAEAAVHETVREDGMMSMRPLELVEIPASKVTLFEPGALHIMLKHLSSPLVHGETFGMTLTFERAGKIEIEVDVRGVGAMAVDADHSHESESR